MRHETNNSRNQLKKKHSRAKNITGILIVAFGIMWLLNNLGQLPEYISYYLFSWKALLICIGVIILFSKNKPNLSGLVLIIVGGSFIAKDFMAFPVDAFHLIVPIIIIGLGMYILFKRMNGSGCKRSFDETEVIDLDRIEEINVFGGKKSYYDSQNFKGGESISVFGGSEIDLSGAKLAKGVQILESVSIFGGSVFIIPKEWNVKVEVVGIMGGFSDKRRKYSNEVIDRDSTLVIKGVAIFGGGEIKNG